MYNFFRPLMLSSSYFKLIPSDVSSTSLSYLDVTVSAVDGFLKVQPTLAKIPCPLPWSSCHRVSVHRSWPQAVAKRTFNLADDKAAAADRLVQVYKIANADPRTISLLRYTHGQPVRPKHLPGNTIACVLRYHPAFAYALQFALRVAPLPPEFGFNILPSWSNALPSTMSYIRKANRQNSASAMYNNQGIAHLAIEEGGNIIFVHSNDQVHGPVTNVNSMSCVFLDNIFRSLFFRSNSESR